jgi:hypothetical protein
VASGAAVRRLLTGGGTAVNTAFDPFIRNVSGAVRDTLNYGDLFSYDRSPRQLIFARNQSGISSLADMQRMMRYNDFEHDPLSSQLETCTHMGWTNCTPPYSGAGRL